MSGVKRQETILFAAHHIALRTGIRGFQPTDAWKAVHGPWAWGIGMTSQCNALLHKLGSLNNVTENAGKLCNITRDVC